jgi:hypothetical protein
MAVARTVGRAALWPVRRLLDPRFADLNRRLHAARQEISTTTAAVEEVSSDVNAIVGGYAATSLESLTYLGRRLAELENTVAALGQAVDSLAEEQFATRIEGMVARGVDALDGPVAKLINHAEGHEGFAAQRELWLNPPLTLEHLEGDVRLGQVNERIVEVPFALRAMNDVAPGSAVLDFGCAESSVSLSLASLGYRVTGLDLRPYPFAHPNLDAVASPLEQWDAGDRRYAAVLVISTVEHVGLGWYGEGRRASDGDVRAMRRLLELSEPGALLVLTVPYGRPSVDALQRRYDRAGLDALLEGWTETDRAIVEQVDAHTWQPVEESEGHAVALVTALAPQRA